MPTGYTAAIADGIDFKTFAKQCARGMGACIDQRDDSLDVPIKKSVPDTYHTSALKFAKKRAERFSLATDEQLKKTFAAFKERQIAEAKKSLADNRELKRKYEAMLAEVNRWKPPTEDHVGLQEFMREQIEESIKWDCSGTYREESLADAEKLTFAKWHADERNSIARDISYHEEHIEQEASRCNSRNEWKRQLLASLETSEPVKARQ